MNFSRKRAGRPAAMQLTAMMDVIFLLLCFFVTSSVFSQWESEVTIALPTAKSATTPGRMPGEIILNVAKDGAISVNGKVISAEEATKRLARVAKLYPGQPVVIRADKATPYEKLMSVLDACRAADVWNFSLATKDDGNEKK